MATEVSLEKAQEEHAAAVDANRRSGVVEYQSREPLSERIYEVDEGLKYLPGGKVLGPGNRFHPTERQVKTGALKGKARELSGSEYSGLRPTTISVRGADIGLRALPMTSHALRLALDAGLQEEDFHNVEPTDGQYTKAQVEQIIASKAN